MRKAFLLVMFSLLTGVLFAVPYASQISVSETQVASGAGLDISYFVNEDGGTATIEIVEEANPSNVAGTFSGTATLGSNTVSWDGTDNNAGGTAIPNGNYRVKITIDATKAAGWTEIASNSSLGDIVDSGWATIYQSLYEGWSGMEMLISKDPDQDSFGYILCSTAYGTPPIYGHSVFNPDLSNYDGGDGSTTWLNFPGTPAVNANTSVWGNCFDPADPEYVWVVGQAHPVNVLRAQWNATTLTDVTNADTNTDNARDIAVAIEGSSKYAYVTNGTGQIWKCDVTNDVVAASPAPFNILGLSDTGRYSKGVDFDANGNLYWSSRYDTAGSSSGDGGAVYRWDKSQIEGVAAGALTEANATWAVAAPTNGSNLEGVAITPSGDVYCHIANEDGLGNDGSVRGIYYCGNASTASNVKTLQASDKVVQTYTPGIASTYGVGIEADYAGNIYWTGRVQEQIRCYSPGGTTSVGVLAPTSQTFFVGVVSARNWILYE